jgi:glycosyltransferase involved in cell wall biosynthesis
LSPAAAPAAAVARSSPSAPPRYPTSDAPLRIAFCIDSLAGSGGTELSTVRTAEQLVARGHSLALFVLRAEGDAGPRYRAAGIPITEVPVRSLVGLRTPRHVLGLARALRAGGFDVVHSHDLYTNVIAGAAGRLARVPAVVGSKRWTGWYRRSHHVLNVAAFRWAHCVVANSERVRDSLSDADHVPRGRTAVVPNFLEEHAFARLSPSEVLEARRALDIPDGAPVVGIVARLREEKDHALLVRAVARLRQRLPALRLLCIGDGAEAARIRALADSLGEGEHVVLAGHRPNRPNPHQLLDVSVLCSRHEGFPNAVIEAMAAGRPVVATAVGGVPDAIVHGTTGLLVPPADEAALAGALLQVLEDPETAARLGRAGERRARELFHVDTVVPQLEALYVRLTARARARR